MNRFVKGSLADQTQHVIDPLMEDLGKELQLGSSYNGRRMLVYAAK